MNETLRKRGLFCNKIFLSLVSCLCTFTSFKYQMLASVMSKQALPQHSAYAFALRATPFGSDIRK